MHFYTVILFLFFAVISCVKVEEIKGKEILSLKCGEDVGVYSNDAPDLNLPRLYYENGYTFGSFFYIGDKSVYYIDAKKNILVRKFYDGRMLCYSNLNFYENAIIECVDENGNMYFSAFELKKISVVETNYTAIVKTVGKNLMADSEGIEDAEEILLDTSNKVESVTNYIPFVVTNNDFVRYAVLHKVDTNENIVTTYMAKEEKEIFNHIVGSFTAKEDVFIVTAGLVKIEEKDSRGRLSYRESLRRFVFRFSTNGSLLDRYDFTRLQEDEPNRGIFREITYVQYIEQAKALALLVTIYRDDKTEWKVYTFTPKDGKLTLRYQSPLSPRDLPFQNALTKDGRLVSGYMAKGYYRVSWYNYMTMEKSRADIIPNKREFTAGLFVHENSIYSVVPVSNSIIFYKWR